MSELEIANNKIDELNRKVDVLLEYVEIQRRKTEELEDLVSDLSVIGKDVFQNLVEALDKSGVEVDFDQFGKLLIKFASNIESFTNLLDMLESFNDLMVDLAPIVHQAGMDTVQFMAKLDEDGYIEFAKSAGGILQQIVTHFSAKDVDELANNIVPILETVKMMTQPDMMDATGNAITVFKHLDTSSVPSYSMWRMFREINSPEMKKGLGFMMTFFKNLSKQQFADNK